MPDLRRPHARRTAVPVRELLAAAAVAAILAGCHATRTTAEMLRLGMHGNTRELREDADPPGEPRAQGSQTRASRDGGGLLLLALDGVDRDLLYDMLRQGELPELAALLGGQGGEFPSAYFHPSMLSCLPSSTMVAWATAMTGAPPARHGIAGNEFFIREQRRLVAPVPVTVPDTAQVLKIYTDGYVNDVALAPTVYERMREQRPDIEIWVAMHQFYRGADRLVLPDRTALAEGFQISLTEELRRLITSEEAVDTYAELDDETVENACELVEEDGPPDVLTIYLTGTDQYAHVAPEGPDAARRRYLVEVVEPLMRELRQTLEKSGGLAGRTVVVTSDHGHTQVVHDDYHSLGTEGEAEPAELLRRAGFRVRPFELEVDPADDFDAVLAYQGAMAYLYLADRSRCPAGGGACDWTQPPRYREDVLAAAEALHRNDARGDLVPELAGTLSLVLVRRPRPYPEPDLPFEVYVGRGKTVPLHQHLARHPMPEYVELEGRLRDLAVGPAGERAGDVLLIARNSERLDLGERYYFAPPYRSFHGSAGRKDSQIPLIVARPGRTTDEVREIVERALSGDHRQQRIGDLLVSLATGDASPAPPELARRRAAIVAGRLRR